MSGTRAYFLRLALLAVGLAFGSLGNGWSAEPLLQPGDRISVVGGTFVERMQRSGEIEAELQSRRPDWKLSLRNLGWSGDDVHGVARKVFDDPQKGYERLLKDTLEAKPTVVLVAYGFSEASDGKPAIDRFPDGLRRLVNDLKSKDKRVILLTPVAMPGYKVAGYDQSISQCRGQVEQIGKETDTPVVSVDWAPEATEVTPSGLLPNQSGYAAYARMIADRLVGQSEHQTGDRSVLREKIAEKNQLFFHRYRPQNETYLFLFRKHEQGNNAVEIPQFDPLIETADQAIWEAAK